MAGPRRYRGQAASPGSAAGLIYQADAAGPGIADPGTADPGTSEPGIAGPGSADPGTADPGTSEPGIAGPGSADPGVAADAAISAATPAQVEAAFAAVAADRRALAERLRADGRTGEADIIAVAGLIAADQVLVGAAVAATAAGGDAAAAVRGAAEAQAAVIEAIPSPELAQRGADVRQVAAAVLDHLAGGHRDRPIGPFILVRRDVAAADLIELAEDGLVGAASVAGGASSHAAIVARGLGIPLITGVDPAVLSERLASRAILAADAGELVIDPADDQWTAAREKLAVSSPRGRGLHLPSRTADGQDVTLLCNVASAAETRRGLADGAAGVGLLRTEIPFTGRSDWPVKSDHLAQLAPILELLGGLQATVRLLDFSGDKIPPFLRDAASHSAGAGLAALLAHPAALADQLQAILSAGQHADLAILVPMVSSLGQVAKVREQLERATAAAGVRQPRLGIMVELAATAAMAGTFAPAVDFFSIGTNDLTGDVLGLDRLSSDASPGLAAEPRVLALIDHVIGAAADAGIPVSVCGDAAADPVVLPLLVGLGVRTFSVPAAYVERVRVWIGALRAEECAALAAKSLTASTIGEVQELVRHAHNG